MPRLALCVALLGAMAQSLSALQLGETKEALVARHGAPGVEDHARNLAMYFWDGWSAQLEFQGNNVSKITYRRSWYLQDEEIAALLEANGGGGRWLEISESKDKTRLWARDDGAAASCPRYRPLNIVFETDSPSEANAATPVAQGPSTNQSVAGASASGAGQNALPPASPEAGKPSADPASTVKVASAAPLPPAVKTAAQPGASEKQAEGQPDFVAARGLGYLFGVLAALALTGSGIYLLKRRFRPIGALPEAARRL